MTGIGELWRQDPRTEIRWHRRNLTASASVPDGICVSERTLMPIFSAFQVGCRLYGIIRKIQRALAFWIGTCPLCHHSFPT
ncbi:hypothetical protein [Nocardia mexicana]|uniref:hypothetical protein n=1 Tax=Nocardia mexicana TaxID=279262 RepID=UPI000B0EDB2B|nr:hypothetical protein [Nocardia mexicana]